MTIEAKIIAHSRSPFHSNPNAGPVPDIITYQLKYPRFIHSEVMTHRLFSRNASSSRAIPVEKMIQNILDDPAMPVHWGKNQPGMQARVEHDAPVPVGDFFPHEPLVHTSARGAWLHACDKAVNMARAFHKAKYHKQVVNRILEPFMHIDVIVTATNYDNFFWLRRHEDAQPEIKVLGDVMWDALQASAPRLLQPGEWHMPYIREEELFGEEKIYQGHGDFDAKPLFATEELLKMSTARCARVSYLTHEGKTPDYRNDIDLYERLVGSEPLHASPTEHQAKADTPIWGDHTAQWENAHLSGNLDEGWVQHRKLLPGEFHQNYEAA